ncbi:MAG: pyridoxal phosphate-dependent aminotransferase [Candidatus Hodarchaeales archaeon]|jgi:aspartate/methionine/tyrosine aminotransferase
MKQLADGMYRILGEGALAVLAKARALEREGKTILHFEIGQPDFPTPPHVKEAGINAINDDFTSYVPADGTLELKEAIQDDIEITRGYRPSTDQILVLPGAKPGVYFAMVGTCNPGDEIIYPDPGFPTYGSVCKYIGARPVPIPLKEKNDFRLDPEDIVSKITSKTKLIILNSPQNPTGSVMTKNELQKVAELAEENNSFILSDEIYSKILYDQVFHSVTVHDEAKERSILVDGFSKSYAMTGWRLGYIIAPKLLVEKLTFLMINALTCTAAFVQKAGIAALKGSQEDIENMVKAYRERRDVIVKDLNEIPDFSCVTPQGAFYTWPNIKKTGKSSQEMAEHLIYNAGVACLPGTGFGSEGEGYLRFSYASSVETIKEAMEKIKNALE